MRQTVYTFGLQRGVSSGNKILMENRAGFFPALELSIRFDFDRPRSSFYSVCPFVYPVRTLVCTSVPRLFIDSVCPFVFLAVYSVFPLVIYCLSIPSKFQSRPLNSALAD